ncbi:hypothetical protein K439DRAFT_1640419 [Ramaria rubella]|nr:hypothetical protein K439DRAFT_1640419 [Ramaria rubella]
MWIITSSTGRPVELTVEPSAVHEPIVVPQWRDSSVSALTLHAESRTILHRDNGLSDRRTPKTRPSRQVQLSPDYLRIVGTR